MFRLEVGHGRFVKPTSPLAAFKTYCVPTRRKEGPQQPLLDTVIRRKFAWVRACHAPRQSLHSLSPKPSFRGHLGGVGRGNAGWTIWKTGHPCPRQKCSRWPSAEKTGRRSQLNRPSFPPEERFGVRTELNWLKLVVFIDEEQPVAVTGREWERRMFYNYICLRYKQQQKNKTKKRGAELYCASWLCLDL